MSGDEWTSIEDEVPDQGDRVEARFDSVHTPVGELRTVTGEVTVVRSGESGGFVLRSDETYPNGSKKTFYVDALVQQVTRYGEERRTSRPTKRRPEWRETDE